MNIKLVKIIIDISEKKVLTKRVSLFNLNYVSSYATGYK